MCIVYADGHKQNLMKQDISWWHVFGSTSSDRVFLSLNHESEDFWRKFSDDLWKCEFKTILSSYLCILYGTKVIHHFAFVQRHFQFIASVIALVRVLHLFHPAIFLQKYEINLKTGGWSETFSPLFFAKLKKEWVNESFSSKKNNHSTFSFTTFQLDLDFEWKLFF